MSHCSQILFECLIHLRIVPFILKAKTSLALISLKDGPPYILNKVSFDKHNVTMGQGSLNTVHVCDIVWHLEGSQRGSSFQNPL